MKDGRSNNEKFNVTSNEKEEECVENAQICDSDNELFADNSDEDPDYILTDNEEENNIVENEVDVEETVEMTGFSVSGKQADRTDNDKLYEISNEKEGCIKYAQNYDNDEDPDDLIPTENDKENIVEN